MKTSRKLFKSFISDERGATAIEYALIATLIAVTLIGAIGFVGAGAGNLFNAATNTATNSLNESSNLLN